MENQCTVQVKLELGHRAQLRKKVTSEGFTHDWMVFVRGPEMCDIQHFVDKVVFRLHESFPKPKRVCKEPPYKVEESGYAGFLMPIEVYFKNKEEPKKVCFNYDLFLNLEGNPPVNHLRCEKLTFNNPTREFRRKLVKAGGVMVVPEGEEAVSRPSPDYPMLPTIPLSAFSDPKKTKPSHGSKEPGKDSSGGSSKGPKPHKLAKEHRERPRKDSESKSASKGESDRDGGSSKPARDPSSSSSSSSSSKKPAELKIKDEGKAPPKAAFKEPKLTLKEGMSPKGGGTGGGGGGGGPLETKAPSKRPSAVESPKSSVKKQKKGVPEGPKGAGGGGFSSTSPRVSSSSSAPPTYSDKKPPKDKGRWVKVKTETSEAKESKKPPESDESNSEDEASSKSEPSAPSSPSNSTSSSDSSSDSDFEPSQKQGQGPLRSMVEDLQSEESDDDDSSSEAETPVKTNPPNRDSRMSLDSESDSSDESHPPGREAPPPAQKHSSSNNKVSGRKSPDPCTRPEKMLKKGYDKAYTEELVDLHRRLMALRERNVLQQIVNLIEETGHFNVTNTTFDFDLFSLDESTVRKLQSYLEATAT
ncbi:protein ENL-like isoform X2 [Megalops cyprinoides]|uniref:protein ENL-like isoform X2 n=1 Tax=Megalops cyprinoides TaxID=118141 RepID=UPI00186526BD|nr:protein ENL-like isoform X2 [Megalops cyprinoides]